MKTIKSISIIAVITAFLTFSLIDAPVFAVTGSAREEVVTRVKTAATAIFNNHFLKGLNTVKEKISTNNKIESTARDAVVASIDEEITWFTEQRNSIDSQTTAEAVRNIVKNARTRYENDRKDLLKLAIAKGYVTSLTSVAKVIEQNVIPRLQDVLTELKGKGVNVTTEQAALDSAQSYMAMVDAKILTIKSSTTIDQAKKAFTEAHDLIKQAREQLEKVRSSLKGKLTNSTGTVTPKVTVTGTPSPSL